ncbi:hypothetical protein Tco_1073121 [Tanacetum coccineum]
MANENVLAPAPTRSDDQILPVVAWVPIGKRNYNTLTYEAKTGTYSFELDETRFVLDANLLREALEITPIDQTHQFVSPPLGEAIMDFVNELGSNVDYVELMWEEFVQAIQTFLTDMANLGSPTKKARKDKAHIIPYCQFTKLIICEEDEVFGMPIPNELISNNIRNASYYNAYLEMVAKHDQKAYTAKPPKPKPAKEKSTKATPLQKASKGKVAKVRNVKSTFQLVDEPDEEPAHFEPEPEPEQEGVGEEYDMECAIQMSLELFQPQVHAHVRGVTIQEPVAEAI